MELAELVDYSLLKPDVAEKQIRSLCVSAKKYKTHSVCVNPCYVQYAR